MKNLAVFIDIKNGQLANSSKRLLDFAGDWAGTNGAEAIYVYGFDHISSDQLNSHSFIKQYIHIKIPGLVNHGQIMSPLLDDVKQKGISQILYVKSLLTDTIASFLAKSLSVPVVSNVLKLQKVSDGYQFTKSIFSGKALLTTQVNGDSFIAAFSKAFSVDVPQGTGSSSISQAEVSLGTDSQNKLIENFPLTGSIPLPDAAIVVGAGRGFKDPSNWGIVEDLAKELGAATACSKPVSDLNWRPHHEHVGQTGVKIAPKLYLACGISGAIQHLAGVNGSRKIVVINNDPEAPFFKHADYGIVGDVFDVLPRLLNKLKSH